MLSMSRTSVFVDICVRFEVPGYPSCVGVVTTVGNHGHEGNRVEQGRREPEAATRLLLANQFYSQLWETTTCLGIPAQEAAPCETLPLSISAPAFGGSPPKAPPSRRDQVIDYQKQNVVDVLGRASVDWVINTQWSSFDQGVAILKPHTGTHMSLTSLLSKETAKEIIGADRFWWWIGAVLDVAQLYYKWKFWGMDIKYEMLSGGPHFREDLEKAGEIIALGKVKAVMRVVDLDDIEAVRKGCMEVFTGEGGIGKMVVKIA